MLRTFGIDGSSSISVEEIESFFDFKNFFFGESWSFVGLSVELLGLCRSSFPHLNYTIQINRYPLDTSFYNKTYLKVFL